MAFPILTSKFETALAGLQATDHVLRDVAVIPLEGMLGGCHMFDIVSKGSAS